MPQTKSGQIAIILTLVLVVLTIITTAVVAVAFSTSRDTTTMSLGEEALTIAHSGAENAVLRLLRDPSYQGGANLPIGQGSATIVVTTSGETKTIVSTGKLGQMTRTIQVQASLVAGQLTILNWQEL